MKVVKNQLQRKISFFPPPQSQYEVCGYNIQGEATSDRCLQTSNDDLGRDAVYSYQEFTKVENLVKTNHGTETQKRAVIQAKLLFIEKVDFFQN